MDLECPPFGCVAALIGGFSFIMSNIQVFNYNGSNITFSNENGVMLNATEMARTFGKTTKDFLRNQSTQDFISALSSVRQILPTEIVIVKQGGANQGTWFHEDLAIEFARWLSPMFAIWCNDHIKELLKKGYTSTSDMTDKEIIAEAFIRIQRNLDELKSENQNLKSQLRLLRTPTARKRMKATADNNNIEEFLEFIGIQPASDGNGKWVSMRELMNSYDDFCKSGKKSASSSKRIGRTLKSKGYARQHKRDGSWYLIAVKMF